MVTPEEGRAEACGGQGRLTWYLSGLEIFFFFLTERVLLCASWLFRIKLKEMGKSHLAEVTMPASGRVRISSRCLSRSKNKSTINHQEGRTQRRPHVQGSPVLPAPCWARAVRVHAFLPPHCHRHLHLKEGDRSEAWRPGGRHRWDLEPGSFGPKAMSFPGSKAGQGWGGGGRRWGWGDKATPGPPRCRPRPSLPGGSASRRPAS